MTTSVGTKSPKKRVPREQFSKMVMQIDIHVLPPFQYSPRHLHPSTRPLSSLQTAWFPSRRQPESVDVPWNA